ncbi:hypothetical protein [uncultured Shewanella sp.]|uniref:hypothetical protein n=1 Tax=uncultured Shewanella sp. TaxID=173975 RepID=UPI002606E383|nr:hypothetical protein [uncultured Shewanella sp.]
MLLINKLLLLFFTIIPLLLTSAMAAENICSTDKKSDILSPITKDNHTVSIDCNLTLDSNDVITKKILFEGETASNTSLNCNNAMIDLTTGIDAGIFAANVDDAIVIQSRQEANNTWSTPQHINIENCRIKGSIRISGMGIHSQDNHIQTSSLQAGHTKRLNEASPHHIMLNNIDIEGLSRPLLHLSPGVNHVTLAHSNLQGVSNTVALYLDAESNFNHINNNTIHVNTQQQLMSLDGSAHNLIKNNHLTLNDNGGIYLFHRCGQENRHQSTSLNQIEANYFTLEHISNNPSINLNARHGEQNNCDNDHADSLNNTIIYNQFLHTNPKDVITFDTINILQKIENKEEILSSYANINVTEFRTDAVAENLEFECYVKDSPDVNEDDYGGIECIQSCPNANQSAVSIRAVCDLEDFMFDDYNAAIPNSDDPRCYGCRGNTADTHYQREVVDIIPWNHIVIRNHEDLQDDNPDNIRGRCEIDGVHASSQGNHTHLTPSHHNETNLFCAETDGNGPDCIVAGQMLCL